MAIISNIPALPLIAVLAAVTNQQDKRGRIKLVEVTPTTDDYFEDKGLSLSGEEILRTLIGTDGDSDLAIRVGFHAATGSTPLTSSELTEEQVMRTWIGKAADGKPYLRLTLDSL